MCGTKLSLQHIHTYHFLSDRVVCCLKVAEHLSYNLLGIAAITHGIQQVSCPLSHTHIPLSLQRPTMTTWKREERVLQTRENLCIDCAMTLTSILQSQVCQSFNSFIKHCSGVMSEAQHLEGIDDCLNVRLDGFVGKLRAGQGTHALQSQVAQVGLSVLQELAQLVTGAHQQVWLTVQKKSKLTSLCWSGKILFIVSFKTHHYICLFSVIKMLISFVILMSDDQNTHLS